MPVRGRPLGKNGNKQPQPMRVHGRRRLVSNWRSVEGKTWEETIRGAVDRSDRYVTVTTNKKDVENIEQIGKDAVNL